MFVKVVEDENKLEFEKQVWDTIAHLRDKGMRISVKFALGGSHSDLYTALIYGFSFRKPGTNEEY